MIRREYLPANPGPDTADDFDQYLFIGGPADGEWKIIPKDAPTAICPVLDLPSGVGAFHLDEFAYRRHVLQSKAVVYVLEGMTLSDASARLLQNYRPERE